MADKGKQPRDDEAESKYRPLDRAESSMPPKKRTLQG
jgi:hypothetical protein